MVILRLGHEQLEGEQRNLQVITPIMGLDMYLSKKHYIGNNYKEPKNQVPVQIPGIIKQERITYIIEEVARWRKANAIHKWFVDSVQDHQDDCKEYYVSQGQLGELVELCKRVKRAATLVKGKVENGATLIDGKWVPNMEDGEVIEDPTIAKQLLPTQKGSFFGQFDYNQYYLQDIDRTIEQLTPLLEEPETADLYYQASW